MGNLLAVWAERLRTGMWPVPLAMILLAGGLFWLCQRVDAALPAPALPPHDWLHGGSGDDARNLLSTLVTAIITMSSIVFSMTVVTLSLASSQFGSRLVRVYLSDMRTKVSLGVFTMTVFYCLLALRAVSQDMPAEEVPQVTVTAGLLLGVSCVLVLLYYLHRVTRSIVADAVVRRIAVELQESIAGLTPLGQAPEREALDAARAEHLLRAGAVVASPRQGYVQVVDHARLLELAGRCDATIVLQVHAGSFVCHGGWVAAVHPREALTPALAQAIAEAVRVGHDRTPTQDIEFSIRHLVDVALRALSPGINDANTALVVVDHLRAALSSLMERALPPSVWCDDSGRVRLIGRHTRYGDVLDAALNQIRQSAAPQPAVIIGMLSAIGRIAEHVRLPEQAEALHRHAGLIARAGLQELTEELDRRDVLAALQAARSRLDMVLAAPPPVVPAGEPEARGHVGAGGQAFAGQR